MGMFGAVLRRNLPIGMSVFRELDMAEHDPSKSMNDVRHNYRAVLLADDDMRWIDAAIDEGLASPPSKRTIAEIMAEQRKALG
jgi:hypothetical protein